MTNVIAARTPVLALKTVGALSLMMSAANVGTMLVWVRAVRIAKAVRRTVGIAPHLNVNVTMAIVIKIVVRVIQILEITVQRIVTQGELHRDDGSVIDNN